MVDAAEYERMLWNGESKGTLNQFIASVLPAVRAAALAPMLALRME